MALGLQSLFGLLRTAVLIGWDPAIPPLPPHLGSYTRALLVSQDRRHLFVTPCFNLSPYHCTDCPSGFGCETGMVCTVQGMTRNARSSSACTPTARSSETMTSSVQQETSSRSLLNAISGWLDFYKKCFTTSLWNIVSWISLLRIRIRLIHTYVFGPHGSGSVRQRSSSGFFYH